MTSSKDALRSQMRALRARLAAASPQAAEALAAHLPAALLKAVTVAAYHPFRNEIDPGPLLDRFAAAGAVLALPVTPARDSADGLTFRVWRDGAELKPGHFAVHEPHPDEPLADPDIVLAPLLAFDRQGHRLGYGAGHFDRTIAELRARKSVLYVGLAYAGQELAELPAEAHDQRLDAILTEKGYRAVRKD
ncbi:MAG: 5-formyltetrahydrofolate cyclo-ligase [Caulobacter sp.]|nr:5-formyltetrahydrofolate cyclo-ligase [Caulobacter sp.]